MTASTVVAEPTSLREQVIEKIAALVTIAFGLVAALAWNTAIQKTFERYFGVDGTLVSFYTYAILVTVVAILATIWIGRSASRAHSMATRDTRGQRPSG